MTLSLNLLYEKIVSEESDCDVEFAAGETSDDGGNDNWIAFTQEHCEILLAEDPEEFEEDELVDPGDIDEWALITAHVQNRDDRQARTAPKATATPRRASTTYALNISLLASLMVATRLNSRSISASNLIPISRYWQNRSVMPFADRAVAVSPRESSKSYSSENLGISRAVSIAFPIGDRPSEELDRSDAPEPLRLAIDLRPALGLFIASPLQSIATRLVADSFVATIDRFLPTASVATTHSLANPLNPAIQILDFRPSPWVYPTDVPNTVNPPAPMPNEIDRLVVPTLQTIVWDGVGGQKVFEIGDQPQQYVIYNFDLVGTGANPSIEVRKGLDALKFIGDGFTADKLQLNQQGADLVITFTGNELVKVILKDRQREGFDNLGLAPVVGIDPSFGVGNILFNTDRVIRDTIDVFDAMLPNPNAIITPFNPNTTTLFNDQNNLVQGFNLSNDIIRGLGGNDVIFGLGGDDRLSGDAGNDILFGNAGNNIMTGGSGADIFALSSDGFSQVTDFNVSEGDRIGLTDGLTVEGLSFETEVTANGTTTWVSNRFTHQRLMELPGITSKVLTSDLFIPISSQIHQYRS